MERPAKRAVFILLLSYTLQAMVEVPESERSSIRVSKSVRDLVNKIAKSQGVPVHRIIELCARQCADRDAA